ncbi:MAG TPA: ATP synthase F0 subunit B [Anaerolineales bacterium]|nr:ATP synthase F0 subunit B [Anaerolineales bacterium]
MDIQHLIDRLEDLVNSARSMPFSRKLLIDEDRIVDIIDQMRSSVPEEVRRAQKVLAEHDRMLAQANEEAERIRELARVEKEKLTEKEFITAEARRKADQIIQQGRQEAERLRQEADQYSLRTLEDLEIRLNRTLQQVRNGIDVLVEQQDEAQSRMPIQDGELPSGD